MKIILSEIKNLGCLVNKVNELEDYKLVNGRVTDALKEDNENLRLKIDTFDEKIDDLEQRRRNDCLLIHGVKEGDDDNTDDLSLEIIKDKLGVDLALDDIQRSHRVGAKPSTRETRSKKKIKYRPIIVRFLNWRKRNEVFRAKSKLKGLGLAITESLTKYRYELLQKATDNYGKGNVWTIDGRVTTKINGTYMVIKNESDMD